MDEERWRERRRREKLNLTLMKNYISEVQDRTMFQNCFIELKLQLTFGSKFI